MWVFNLFVPFAYFCSFYVVGILADLITTRIALNKGLSEGNPLMAKFKDPVLVSGIVSLITVIFAAWASQYQPVTASIFCLVFGAYRVICGLLNYNKIKKLKKEES